jgi:flagellar hook assembly protein FlgD
VGATSISFSVVDAVGAWNADIYDLSGRLVRRLEVPSGSRTGAIVWDGRNRSGADASPGVYFVRLSGIAGSAQMRIVKLD